MSNRRRSIKWRDIILSDDLTWVPDDHIPETRIEALMRAGPYTDPAESTEDILEERENVIAAIETLDDQERLLVHALFYEQLSLREAASRFHMSHTSLARWRDDTLDKLKGIL